MKYGRQHVLVAGFAQFPKGTPVHEQYKVIGCILIIDITTDIVVEATFTFLIDTTRNFVSSIVTGQSLKNGITDIVKEVERRVHIPGQKALIQSIIAAYERYCELKAKNGSRPPLLNEYNENKVD